MYYITLINSFYFIKRVKYQTLVKNKIKIQKTKNNKLHNCKLLSPLLFLNIWRAQKWGI